MISSSVPSYDKIVDRYCDAVLSGKRTAGRYERYAVERYLHDVEHAAQRGLYFNKEYARLACQFYPDYIRHSVGEWAGDALHLSDWQVFAEWNIHGWRWAETGLRRFRKAYITVARKNGKTTWCAGSAIRMTCIDWPEEPHARTYCAATKREQAALLWQEARRMVEASPRLSSQLLITGGNYVGGGRIIVKTGPQKGSEFTPLGSDSSTTDGLNISLVIKDELHEWSEVTHRGLHEKLSSASGSRRQGLEITIGTAGADSSIIWAEEDEYASNVVENGARGVIVDDTVFSLIFRIDEEDEPLDPEVWPKANPNLDVSVKSEYLKAQAAEAAAKPSAYNKFVRYHCNRRVASFQQTYPKDLWDRGIQNFPEPQQGDLCYAAFDLSTTNDWSAAAAVFPQEFVDADGVLRWRYVIKTKSWCCTGVNVQTDYSRDPYRTWIASGLLEYQPGNEIVDRTPLKAWLLDLMNDYDVRQIGFDRHTACEITTDLFNTYGAPVQEFPQTHLRYTEPLQSFERALTEGRIDHGNDPVLNWQAGNCETHYNPQGREMIKKGNQQRWKKIDAMVSVAMAYGLSIVDEKYAADGPALLT